ncbi:MAG: Trm112 family protein [Propionibacteriaceae bacterium]
MTQLNEALLGILACPNCRSSLVVDYEASELVCAKPECGLAYPVRDSIPILLVDEARAPGHKRAGVAGDHDDDATHVVARDEDE